MPVFEELEFVIIHYIRREDQYQEVELGLGLVAHASYQRKFDQLKKM